MDGLTRHNVKEEDIQVAYTRCFETCSLIASKMAKVEKSMMRLSAQVL